MASLDKGAASARVDSEPSESQSRTLAHDATLKIAQSVSLMLGSDSLDIVDGRIPRKSTRGRYCCGFLGRPKTTVADSNTTHAISLYNVLDADVSAAGLTITYAQPTGADDVAIAALQYPVADKEKPAVESWVQGLLGLAYGDARRYKRLKVLVNPYGGKGTAAGLYDRYAAPIFAGARCKVDVETTLHSGHAMEICQRMDIDAYDAVVACSGDGLPYEVFNGLGKKPNAREALAKVAVAMIPCGSGNAMAWNLCGTGSVSVAALAIVKGRQTPLDLVSITQGNTRTLSFLSQSFGIVAESDLGTEHIRWMGAHRFTYGFLVRLMQRTVYPCDLAIKVVMDDKKAIKDHYASYRAQSPARRHSTTETGALPDLQYGTVLDAQPEDWQVIPGETLGNFYAGNMAIVSKDANFFPASLPNDGLLDIVTIDGTISRATSLKMMTEVPEGGFFDMPEVNIRKALAYRLVPRQKEGYLSVDGEKVPFEALQVEVHKGLGTVLSKSGQYYEADGPRP